MWGKTLRDGDNNVFGIKRNPQTKICPVQGIEHYMAAAQKLRIDLTRGYLFCPTTSRCTIHLNCGESSFKGIPKGDGIRRWRNSHGFRAGCAITLALPGAELSEIIDHVGWTRRHTALHYLQSAKVLNPAGAPARLSTVHIPTVTSGWNDVNVLRRSSVPFLHHNREKVVSRKENLFIRIKSYL